MGKSAPDAYEYTVCARALASGAPIAGLNRYWNARARLAQAGNGAYQNPKTAEFQFVVVAQAEGSATTERQSVQAGAVRAIQRSHRARVVVVGDGVRGYSLDIADAHVKVVHTAFHHAYPLTGFEELAAGDGIGAVGTDVAFGQVGSVLIAIMVAIAALTSLATTLLWGRVADAAGNKGVLAIGTFIAGALLPANWILAGLTGNLTFIWSSAFFDAVAWGAITPAIFNLALVSAPKEGRVSFVAGYSLVTGVAGFVGGALSGPLLALFQTLPAPAFASDWSGYHTLFAVSAVGRVFAWVLLRRVTEAHAWRTRDLLRTARTAWRVSGRPWR